MNTEVNVLRKDERLDFVFEKTENNKSSYRLFFNCEDVLCSLEKNESGAEHTYMLIDDSLNFNHAHMNRYCLDMSCTKPRLFPKRILKKIVWQPLFYGLYLYEDFCRYNENWSFGVSCKAENLEISENGYLNVRVDKWFVKEGVNINDTTLAPDETYVINVPSGTYPYKKLEKSLIIEKDKTACIIITVEGEQYKGNVYFECPFLCDNEGRNLLPEFERGMYGLKRFAWFGQNLSKKEWPVFEIQVNGKVVFSDEVFLKIHNFSPIEIDLPEECFEIGKNNISIIYKSDYLDTVPVKIGEVVLLEKEIEDFSLVYCPQEVIKGEDVKLLIETQNNVEPSFESEDFCLVKKKVFEEHNLQILTIRSDKEKNDLSFKLSFGTVTKTYSVLRCITKTPDNVIAGTGDMIYIDVTNLEAVKDYVKWYIRNDIGKMITIRPVYRWGGQRYVNNKVWEFFKAFCEEMGLLYVNLSDGRDIPGITSNPAFNTINGENFLGRQLHERDGQLFYWRYPSREVNAEMNEFFDLALRLGREKPDNIDSGLRNQSISWHDNMYSLRRNLAKSRDLKEMHDVVSCELSDLTKDNFTRHTGPSVMFKYYYQNGFKWTGAETMDGATEMLLMFLRGASYAYAIEKFGVHLALQWSTYPHDTEQRLRRYLLSLYIPYMHGVTDINTEEGLWFIEARYSYYNRLSQVCENHRQQNSRFNKFIRTHSRTGKFYTPVAFLHGRCDGWNGFITPCLWGMPNVRPGDESLSWKLLSCFYPLNSFENCDMENTGFIPPDNDKPFGLFSGTPNGNADAVPVEKGDFKDYSVLIFAGYNMADKDDLDRVYSFVEQGGTLVCSWAHFTDTTEYEDLKNYKLNILEHKITNALSDGKPEFATDYVDGKEVLICKNLVNGCQTEERTDSKTPLVCTYNIGKGTLVLVNTLYYPGNKNIYDVYKRVVERVCKQAYEKEEYRVNCSVDVQYTVFKQDDNSYHYYLTPVDWYNNSNELRKAEFLCDGYKYDIGLPFGEITKLVAKDKKALWPESDSTEIVAVEANGFYVQGEGKQIVNEAYKGKIRKHSVDFSNESIKFVEFHS
ncbi:MAG: hypothetical protein J6K12_07765 [Clostridia bacterium]|nr:hypothetical protein [Clostridia bacterium]